MKDWLKLLTQYPGSVMPLAYPITSYISLTRWRYQEPRVTTAFTLEKNYFAHSQKMKLFSWITQFWCILMHFFWFLDNFLFWKVPGLLHCAPPTFGQCPKENVFFHWCLPLGKVSCKKILDALASLRPVLFTEWLSNSLIISDY